jgi:hypothetical protein
MQRPASPPFGLPSHVASNAACACGAQTILSPAIQAITVLARSTPPKKTKWAACSASLRPHRRDGVTVAARRDAPMGVGTRNVPQDSPAPPAGRTRNYGEQAKAKQSSPPSGAPSPRTGHGRPCTMPRTNAATVAQPRVRAPRRLCKSIARNLGRSPSLLHIRRPA